MVGQRREKWPVLRHNGGMDEERLRRAVERLAETPEARKAVEFALREVERFMRALPEQEKTVREQYRRGVLSSGHTPLAWYGDQEQKNTP